MNHIGGVMASVLTSSTVDLGCEPPSGQTKDWKIDICYFSSMYAALGRKSKDWLARNQDNVSEWGNMSTCSLLFHWTRTWTKRIDLVQCLKWTVAQSTNATNILFGQPKAALN